MLARIATLLLALAASLILSLPIDVFRLGFSGITTSVRFIGLVYVFVLFLWVAGQQRLFGDKFSPPRRTFNEAVAYAFLSTLPWSLIEFATAAAPSLGSFIGTSFVFGMSVALVVQAPYATYDHPTVENKRYWRGMALYPSIVMSLLVGFQLVRHWSTAAALRGLLIVAGWPCGLWAGLSLGHSLKEWSVVLAQVFRFLHRLSRPMMAFAFGYFVIITVFASGYAALWKLDVVGSFSGLPGQPSFEDFLYFSFITAATVGYGDIVPHSTAARFCTCIEIVVSLAWTIVVFALLMSIFANPRPSNDK